MFISNTPTDSPSGHSRSSSSDSSRSSPPSSRRSSDHSQHLPPSHHTARYLVAPASPVLGNHQLDSLKVYSHSLQHLTYQLFKNLHPDLLTDAPLSPIKSSSCSTSTPCSLFTFRRPHDSTSSPGRPLALHSVGRAVGSSTTTGGAQSAPITHAPHRSASRYPRRARRAGPCFPDHTGL